jgi:sulfur-oxidizing protein SoxZ
VAAAAADAREFGIMPNGPYVKIPESAAAGQIIAVKAKLKHPMETGWRKTRNGQTVPRNRIHKFVCTFNGAEVFRAELHSGVSADPYLMFPAKVTESGTFGFIWFEDGGRKFVTTAEIEVS